MKTFIPNAGKGLELLAFARHFRHWAMEVLNRAESYCDTGPRVLQCRSKDTKSQLS